MSQPIEERNTCSTCRHFEVKRDWVTMIAEGWAGECKKQPYTVRRSKMPACSKYEEKS